MIMRHLAAGETDGDLYVLVRAMTSEWISIADSFSTSRFLTSSPSSLQSSSSLPVQSIYRSTITVTRSLLPHLFTIITMEKGSPLIMVKLKIHFSFCASILDTLLTRPVYIFTYNVTAEKEVIFNQLHATEVYGTFDTSHRPQAIEVHD